MKKLASFVMAILLILSLPLIVSATIVADGNTTYWYPWVMDGSELTLGSVKISDEGIVAEHSSNWEIRAQDKQEKITDTYMSPATVWTTDTTKDFVLTYKAAGGSKVRIGFLHTVGEESVNAGLATVAADGSDLGSYVKLYSSSDGKAWTELATTFNAETAANRTPVLINGMTGYDTPITTKVGDGTQAYNEFYYIAETTLPQDATLVKYVYVARERQNFWDPVVRDAAFEAPATPEAAPDNTTAAPSTGDGTFTFAILAVAALGSSLLLLRKKRVI